MRGSPSRSPAIRTTRQHGTAEHHVPPIPDLRTGLANGMIQGHEPTGFPVCRRFASVRQGPPRGPLHLPASGVANRFSARSVSRQTPGTPSRLQFPSRGQTRPRRLRDLLPRLPRLPLGRPSGTQGSHPHPTRHRLSQTHRLLLTRQSTHPPPLQVADFRIRFLDCASYLSFKSSTAKGGEDVCSIAWQLGHTGTRSMVGRRVYSALRSAIGFLWWT